jgi:aldehyde dehydrogenase family 7 member A1
MASELCFSDFPFLADLGLSEDNAGCFDGDNWTGSGEVFTSYNPANNKPIARIRTVCYCSEHTFSFSVSALWWY